MEQSSSRRQQTRQDLLDAFWRILEREGFRHLNVQTVTKTAGYNRGTFYEYFPYIEALIDTAEEEVLETMVQGVRQIFARLAAGGNKDTVQEVFSSQDLFLFTACNPRIHLLLSPRGDPGFLQKYKAAMLPTVLETYHLDGSDPRVRIAYEYGISAYIQAVYSWTEKTPSLSAEEVIKLLSSLQDQGFLPVIRSLQKKP